MTQKYVVDNEIELWDENGKTDGNRHFENLAITYSNLQIRFFN
jgi:hypothetical protein